MNFYLANYIWRCFVDDNICFGIKVSLKFILNTLTNFHDENIKFIFEEEKDGKLLFLGVLLVRNNRCFDTVVQREKIHTDPYLNWNSFGLRTRKWGTLKIIVKRAFEICPSDNFLEYSGCISLSKQLSLFGN